MASLLKTTTVCLVWISYHCDFGYAHLLFAFGCSTKSKRVQGVLLTPGTGNCAKGRVRAVFDNAKGLHENRQM